jgi:creatinine amidohydrolase
MRTPFVIVAFAVIAAAGLAARQQTSAPPPPRAVALEELAWPEAESALRPETVVVIPLGAASKEHGPHLKLRNDLTMADYLAGRVRTQADVVLAPPLTYHFYPAFVEYPGSTTLTADTARDVTTQVVRSLARFGPRRFYVLNTGISTVRPLQAAAETLAAEGILLTFTDLNARLEPTAAKLRQQEGGTHADEIETSMMLYIDPGSVDMTRAVRDYTPSSGPPRLTRQRGAQGTYSPSGVWGDPTLATRAKGERLVEALVAGVLDDIERLRRSGLPAATPPRPSPATTGSVAGAPPPARPSGCTPGDERAIRQIGDAFTYHWANADAEKLSQLWTLTGDIIHPDGSIERLREVIFTNRVELLRRREYRGSKHPVTITMIRCLGGDLAVADGRWSLRFVPGGAGPGAAGPRIPDYEGQMTIVARRAGDSWLIDAYRYTIKHPDAPTPSLLKRPGWPDGRGGR